MSIYILSNLNKQITTKLAKGASMFLGETESNIENALTKGIFPVLMFELINKTKTQEGAISMLSVLKDYDGKILDNIDGLFRGGSDAVAGLMNDGSDIQNMLLGEKITNEVENISKLIGIQESTTSSLLKMAAPIFLNIVGSHVRNNGLSLSGFEEFINAQNIKLIEEPIQESESNLSVSINTKPDEETLVNTNIIKEDSVVKVEPKKNMQQWLLPLTVLILLFGYFFGLKNGCIEIISKPDESNKKTIIVEDNLKEDTVNSISTTFDDIDPNAQSVLESLKFKPGSIGQQIMLFIKNDFKGDNSFVFNDLSFDSESDIYFGQTLIEIDNLAKILLAYPSTTIDVEGFTDNLGESVANVELSKARVSAIKARLVTLSIDAGRIGTAGLGSALPIADNSTEKGRIKNNRVELRFSN